jgi:hypothetical protein
MMARRKGKFFLTISFKTNFYFQLIFCYNYGPKIMMQFKIASTAGVSMRPVRLSNAAREHKKMKILKETLSYFAYFSK